MISLMYTLKHSFQKTMNCLHFVGTQLQKLQTIERINNPGIKYRKMNMQIGVDRSLRVFFTQPRFSNYFIGELHVFTKI